MKQKHAVIVGGREYILISDEQEEYVRSVAAVVDKELTELMEATNLSINHAAVLTALNSADQARKALASADHLREQVKSYLDETQKLKNELADTRRELNKLKKQGQA